MSAVNELRKFFTNLTKLFYRSLLDFRNKDTVCAEVTKSKLEDYLSIILAISGALTTQLIKKPG